MDQAILKDSHLIPDNMEIYFIFSRTTFRIGKKKIPNTKAQPLSKLPYSAALSLPPAWTPRDGKIEEKWGKHRKN